jgi:hypothetical protein
VIEPHIFSSAMSPPGAAGVGTHSESFCQVEAVRIADKIEGLIYLDRAYHPIAERIAE